MIFCKFMKKTSKSKPLDLRYNIIRGELYMPSPVSLYSFYIFYFPHSFFIIYISQKRTASIYPKQSFSYFHISTQQKGDLR